jgi:hypothetical protein
MSIVPPDFEKLINEYWAGHPELHDQAHPFAANFAANTLKALYQKYAVSSQAYFYETSMIDSPFASLPDVTRMMAHCIACEVFRFVSNDQAPDLDNPSDELTIIVFRYLILVGWQMLADYQEGLLQ